MGHTTSTHHSFLLLHVRRDQIVQKEERIGVHRHKDVVLELGDETALDDRFLAGHVGRLGALHVLGFEVEPQTRQRKDHLPIVIVILELGRCTGAGGLRARALDGVRVGLSVAFEHRETVNG